VNQPKINISTLLDKLIELEQSIGMETDATLRSKVCELQDIVVQLRDIDRKGLKVSGPRRVANADR
jgi:hypothetical protein